MIEVLPDWVPFFALGIGCGLMIITGAFLLVEPWRQRQQADRMKLVRQTQPAARPDYRQDLRHEGKDRFS